MKTWVSAILLFMVLCAGPSLAQDRSEQADERPAPRTNTVASPLIERYILDEIKSLRIEMQELKVKAIQDITDRELQVADKAVSYSNNTVTFFFYVFLGLASILTLLGWNSLKELKQSVSKIAEEEVSRVSQEYEGRLTALEEELQSKGEEILENQREIEKTQTIHALWLQANQVVNPRTKIEVYDRILELDPTDSEVMAYKADAALQLGERDWALSLCNRILEDNPESSLGYYQRACARAGLEDAEGAITDLAQAIDLSETLREPAREEEEFLSLHSNPDFRKLVHLPELVDGEEPAESQKAIRSRSAGE